MKNVMKYCVLLSLLFLTFSCQEKKSDVAPSEAKDSIVSQQDKQENILVNDTIRMNYKNEKGLYVAKGVLDSVHPRMYFEFKNEELGLLKSKIIPTTGKGNIRFNQIIFPDNTATGPFGMDLEMDLKQTGKNTLVIGHSLMADNPFWGEFKVQLEIVN